MIRFLRSLFLCALALTSAFAIPRAVQAQTDAPALSPNTARIHYHRPRGDYDGWGLHTWEGAVSETPWGSALKPAGRDAFGVWWDVPMKPAATKLGLIVHKGDQKDPGTDMFLDFTKQKEAYIVSGQNELHANAPDVSALAFGDLGKQRAHWVDRRTLLWPGAPTSGATYTLHASPTAALRLTTQGIIGGTSVPLQVDANGMSAELRTQHPYLAGATVLRVADADVNKVGDLLRGQLAVAQRSDDGRSGDATGVQIPGVLDDLYAHDVSV